MADPIDKDDLLEVFRRIVPLDFSVPIEASESFALFRGLADSFARLAQKGDRSQQGVFFLPHALQTDLPASSGIRASGTATFASRNLPSDFHSRSAGLRRTSCLRYASDRLPSVG